MAYLLISGNAFLLPFYLETIKGLNPQKTGMILLLYSVIYFFLSPYAGRLSDKINPSILCIVAMASASVNAFVFSFSMYEQGFVFVITFLIWLALSFVLFFSPNNNQIMSIAPAGKHGIASGIFNTTINLSTVFGVAIFESVFSQFLPGISTKSANLLNAGIPREILLKGFSAAYVLGGIVCMLALGFSIMVMIQSKKRGGGHE